MALLCPDNLGSLSSVVSGNHGPGDVDVCFGLKNTLFHDQHNQGAQSFDFGHNNNQEFDCFLQFQNERLRWALQKQRNQQVATLINKASFLMTQKDQDLAQATHKATALRDYLRKTEAERDSWQRLAMEKEAMVAELKERLVLVSNTPDDAQSSNGDVKMGCNCNCKSCNTRSSSVLFLPCRHLCSCKSCEPFLASCPVCQSVKETSLEVLFV